MINYSFGKRCVFKNFLKDCTVGTVRKAIGKSFHNLGPKTENALSPNDLFDLGIERRVESWEDLSPLRPELYNLIKSCK